MAPGEPLGEEEIITTPSQDHIQYAVIQPMSRKTKQTRATGKTREMKYSITKTEMETARSNVKVNTMIKILEVTIRGPDFPAECAQRLLIQIYWDVQSSRSFFQAN